eukprot:1502435-Ditylum_brightwellii.AAC.1
MMIKLNTPNGHTKLEYIQDDEHNKDVPPPDNDVFVNYPDEKRSKVAFYFLYVIIVPKNQQQW